MAIPDISTLTLEELSNLAHQVSIALEEKAALTSINETTLRNQVSTDVDTLMALIGPSAATATPGIESVNELLATSKATIEADIAAYFKHALRIQRKALKAQLAAARVASGRTESTSIGA